MTLDFNRSTLAHFQHLLDYSQEIKYRAEAVALLIFLYSAFILFSLVVPNYLTVEILVPDSVVAK